MNTQTNSTPPAAGEAAHTLPRYRVIIKSLMHDSAWLAVGLKQLGPMSIGVAKEIAHRCNSHDALVALRDAVQAHTDLFDRIQSGSGENLAEAFSDSAKAVRAALNAAKL